MEEIKDRIRTIMERENMSPKVFADSIGVQQSTLSHILNARNRPSLEVVMKVHQRYSYVNLEWLLYGNGGMTNPGKEGAFPSLRDDYQPTLFDERPVNPGRVPGFTENRKEMALKTPEKDTKEIVRQEIKYIEKPAKKITEIRVFFDDNTYETFRPEK